MMKTYFSDVLDHRLPGKAILDRYRIVVIKSTPHFGVQSALTLVPALNFGCVWTVDDTTPPEINLKKKFKNFSFN